MPLSIEDQIAILALVARYNHAVDSGDVETRAATFTEDGVWDSETGGVVRGREAILAHARDRAPHAHTWKHWTNNPVIEGDGDAATIRQYMMLVGVDGALRIRMLGTYHDTLRREPDGWRFAYRKLVTHARAD